VRGLTRAERAALLRWEQGVYVVGRVWDGHLSAEALALEAAGRSVRVAAPCSVAGWVFKPSGLGALALRVCPVEGT
jgi:hypothetical protein